MTYTTDKVLADLKPLMKPARYQHTLGVVYTAAALCMCYGQNVEKGMLAGALHDCAKITSVTDYIATCNKYGVPVSEDAKKAPHLLHADLGAFFAKTKYQIEDEEILHAIMVHTTGCPNMSVLDKILFIADYIEPGRTNISNLDRIRKEAFSNLNQCMLMILGQTLEYLKSKGFYIGSKTVETYDFYNNNNQEEK